VRKSDTKPRLIAPESARKSHIHLKMSHKVSTPPGVLYSFYSLLGS